MNFMILFIGNCAVKVREDDAAMWGMRRDATCVQVFLLFTAFSVSLYNDIARAFIPLYIVSAFIASYQHLPCSHICVYMHAMDSKIFPVFMLRNPTKWFVYCKPF